MNPLRALLRDDLDLVGLLERTRFSLDARVPQVYWELALAGPAREMLRRPGKQFRARLVDTAWVLGGGDHAAMPAHLPLAVEILHAGSLIVDDIEDDSDERRGAPTLHRLVGLPLALNTGNWMYFWAIDVLQKQLPADRVSEGMRAAMDTMLACHQGQALDIAIKVADVPQADMASIVAATTELKTGALMALAARLGALAAGADHDRLDAIAGFGKALGVGLQMLDDMGGLTSSRRQDKGLEDIANGRATWVWAWLARELDELTYRDLRTHAREVSSGNPAEPLRDRLRELLGERGKLHVRTQLAAATEGLRATIGDHPALSAVEGEVQRLERSYE